MIGRALAAAVALASALLCAWLAWHHPLSPPLVLAACGLLAALTLARPAAWPLWLLPLLPLIGLMPWTGWLVVEEFDLAVLAVAAAGYLRLAAGWPAALPVRQRDAADSGHAGPGAPSRMRERGGVRADAGSVDRAAAAGLPPSPSPTASHAGTRRSRARRSRGKAVRPATDQPVRSLLPVLLLLVPLAVSIVVSMQRGFADAGGLVWGWWQGYREPLNSLRLAKPLFEVLLLLPLWHAACRAGEAVATARLRLAMSGLLLGVALAVVWERLAFTGLLDFSSDYRATGPFWEMHVGGAALDAVLSMALPFALAALAAARTPLRWAAAATLLALGLYAALVTFSRIVYLAVPVALALWWALNAARARTAGSTPRPVREVAVAALGIVGFTAAAAWSFPASGYRGLLALFGALVLLLPLPPVLRALSARAWIVGAALGLVAIAAVAAVTARVPKGAYFAYGAAWVGTALLTAALMTRTRPAGHAVALATFMATLGAIVAVGVNWGGAKALAPSLTAALTIAVVALAASALRTGLWPASWRWQGQFLGVAVAAAAVVAVFGGGAYMGSRMSSSTQDSHERRDHWQHALGLLGPADWMFGKGLGRYTANQALSGLLQDQTGDYRLQPAGTDGQGQSVVLTSGKHELGWGEIFRLSQRVASPAPGPGPALLQLKVRTAADAAVHVEVCEKHLLYNADCIEAARTVKAAPQAWQDIVMALKGSTLKPGPWYATKLVVFSIGLESAAARVEIDDLHLVDASGRELIANGDFELGLARWFFSSDKYHLPWHLKNVAMHLVFEQGLFGLASFALVVAAALWRVTFGAARHHALAPVLAAAVVGLLIVGLVDSIFDMPRVAFLTLLLLVVALALPALGRAEPARARRPGPGPQE